MAGIITDASKIYNTVMDFCRMNGLDNPAQYWIDPSSPQAGQAAQQMAQSEQMQAQAQQATQDKIINIEQFKVMNDAQQQTRDHELKVAEQLMKSEDTQDDNTREWSSLELQYGVDIKGKGADNAEG
jgi:uncharacterized membrane protein YgaE (UPF0421/DUF939 family)